MARHELQLDCVNCKAFKDYVIEQKDAAGRIIVCCGECGKRHSDDRVHMVDPTRHHERDESGELEENYL